MLHSALLTDYYELTMAQGYFLLDNNPPVVFDMFFRRNPFQGAYTVFAGLNDFLDQLEHIEFSAADIAFLEEQEHFDPDFLAYLRNFKFTGKIYAVAEGSLIFPNEPIIRVHGNMIDCQIIESRLLNQINFQSLIATKTARIVTASKNSKLIELGLRRAQGFDGALSASRAAFIGGASATSNVLAAKRFKIPIQGTMAHSWVLSFPNELEAFRSYIKLYPTKAIFLIDTYDTLGSGIESALIIGKELKAKGQSIAVRLDSGDLQYLSYKVRKILDAAGLTDAKIIASNDLDENIIDQLLHENSPIDIWGVGTQLVTGGSDSSLAGVYKLAARQEEGTWKNLMKISNNPEKNSNPGVKQVYRFFDKNNSPILDLITFIDEHISTGADYECFHPVIDQVSYKISKDRYARVEPLLKLCFAAGKNTGMQDIHTIQTHCKQSLSALDDTYKRILNPHIYKVSVSNNLRKERRNLLNKLLFTKPI